MKLESVNSGLFQSLRVPCVLGVLCGLFLAACGGTSTGELTAGSNPDSAATSWSGTWLSRTGVGGTDTIDMAVSGGSVTGTISFTNSPCFNSGTLSGTLVDGALTGTVTAGAIEVSVEAVVLGTQLSGTYVALSAGACTGDTGTLLASQ